MGLPDFGLIAIIVVAAACYLLGAVAGQVASPEVLQKSSYSIDFRRLRDGTTVALALVLAFYLMFISIVATQIFDPKFADPRAPRERLEQGLSRTLPREAPESLVQFSHSIANSNQGGDLSPVLDSIQQVNPQLSEYARGIISQYKRYIVILEDQSKLFTSRAKQETDFLLSQFDLEN